MACGKSSVGKCLSELYGSYFIDLDSLVEQREGLSVPELFKQGEEVFRKAEAEALRSILCDSKITSLGAKKEKVDLVLSLGGGSLMYASSRDLVLNKTFCIWLRSSLAEIKQRVGTQDSSRPLFKDAERLFAEREKIYAMARMSVDTEGLSPHEIARRIYDRVFI